MKRFSLTAVALCLGLIQAAHAVPTNLAPSGVATASSTLGPCCGSLSFAPSLANDGNRAGPVTGIFHTNNSATPAFFQIDLGTNKFLDRVEIFPRNAVQNSVESFKIEVFDTANNLSFSKNYLVGQSTNDLPWGTSELRNVFGSRVVLTRLDATPDFMTFAEFEIYGQNTPIMPNIALGKTVTGTSAGAGTTFNDAIDGDIDGHYSHIDSTGVGSTHPIFHSNTSGPSFWQVDLGVSQELDYVNLFSRTDFQGNGSAATLEVLANDGTTVVFAQALNLFGTDLGGQRFGQVIDMTSVTGRFVRITANTAAGGNNFLTLAEVEVFAQQVPEPATGLLGLLALAALGRRQKRHAAVSIK